jgi:hypothetical protein
MIIPPRFHLYLVAEAEPDEAMRPARGRTSVRGETAKAIRAGRSVKVRLTAGETIDGIIRAAIDHNTDTRAARGHTATTLRTADTRFLHRITVNFLRHTRTCYDHTLVYRRSGSGGPAAAYNREVKLQVLATIAARYPDLAVECARQSGHALAGEGLSAAAA